MRVVGRLQRAVGAAHVALVTFALALLRPFVKPLHRERFATFDSEGLAALRERRPPAFKGR